MIEPGQELKGRYRIDRLLGRGGMASVWLATDEVLERPVAVKVLSDAIASDPEYLARFRREARVAASLSHPNLAGIYDFAESSERPYLVMEHVAGGTLAERFSSGESIDCERLARELLGALDHIHAAGIVHRDVKPQNVLFAEDGSTRLIDFGIALPQDATALTRTGSLLGTARYIAPEVMRGGVATERSDLFSCGVVLRDCVGEGRESLTRLVGRLTCEDPGGRPDSARAALALTGRPAARAQAATEPLEATREWRAEKMEATRGWRAEEAPAVRGPSRRPWVAPVAAAASLASVLLAVLALSGSFGGGGDQRERSAGAPGPGGGDRTAGGSEAVAQEVPEPAGSDPSAGSALNEEGYAMIQEGRPEEAIPVLEEAVRSFPAGTEDLSYGYALFNLGSALRLAGRPDDAIPVLERRLEIPDQTAVVRRELAAARADAAS